MCGIAGLIGRRSDGFAERVGARLAHRGPDDSGLWQDSDACLVHRRLAILDLTPNGHQPMSTACGRWHLVFNGEIYNHRTLRRELLAEGQRFRGTGDTEVLLAWMVRYGTAGLDYLRGMYAFCLYDSENRTALLARDPHGIKPLYYWEGQGGELAFASELRALLAGVEIPRRLDPKALGEYLCTGSVAEPLTLVDGVRRLPAGHWALWTTEQLVVSPWCPVPEQIPSSTQPIPTHEAVDLCRSALQSSVTAHLESDVPVGLFLSGGLDSAAMLALSPPGLHAFTIGFPTPGAQAYDESLAAAEIAKLFDAPHVVLPLGANQVNDWLEEFLHSQDQPSIDGYNTWCVSRLVSEHGFKVAISGLGGDEIFGGYPSFQVVPRLHRWRQRLGGLAGPLAKILRRSPAGTRHRVQRLAAMLDAPPSLEASYRCLRSVFAPFEAKRLADSWGIDLIIPASSPDYPSQVTPSSDLDAVAWLEGTNYLRNQLLPDSDVMAMAAGLELRLPLVDATLQTQLARIPASQRLATGKQLLQMAVPELPDWFVQRKKQGFRFPFQIWLDTPNSPLTLSLPSCSPEIDMRPWYRRWSLLILDNWLKSHLDIELPHSHEI